MNLLMAVCNFVMGLGNIAEGLRNKRIFSVVIGLIFAACSGVYTYLATKNGELEIKFFPQDREGQEAE